MAAIAAIWKMFVSIFVWNRKLYRHKIISTLYRSYSLQNFLIETWTYPKCNKAAMTILKILVSLMSSPEQNYNLINRKSSPLHRSLLVHVILNEIWTNLKSNMAACDVHLFEKLDIVASAIRIKPWHGTFIFQCT